MNQEKLYKRNGRRYVEASMPERFDMQEGVWLVTSKPGVKSMSSLYWKVGDLKRPVDIVTHAGLQTLEDDLARYLMALGKADSKEFIEAKEVCGAWLKEPVGYYNISASQLVSLFIRKLATYLEEGETMHWDSLQMKFRSETELHKKPEFEQGIKVLYQFTEWLKKNNIKFRKGNNIG